MRIKNLDKLAPVQKRRYALHGVVAENGNGKPVVLVLLHAGDHNANWRNAINKIDANGAGEVNGEEWMRSRIAPLAKHVIVDWENAFDDNGKPEPYTASAGEKLLNDLLEVDQQTKKPRGGDIVYRALMYAIDPTNFRDTLDDGGVAERLGKE